MASLHCIEALSSSLPTIRNVRSVLIDPLSFLNYKTTLPHFYQIHAHFLTSGHLTHSHLHFNKLISSISLNDRVLQNSPLLLHYSHLLLSHSPISPSTFAFNALIRANSKQSPLSSFQYYNQLLHSPRLSPDNYTFTFLIRASTQLLSVAAGSAVHGCVFARGFTSDPHVISCLIHLYAQLGLPDYALALYSDTGDHDLVTQTALLGSLATSGKVDYARKLFDEMPERDLVAWNAMIAGYSHAERPREALDLFGLMLREKVRVTEVTLVSVLSACADLGVLDQGEWVHAFVKRNKLTMNVTLGTALIDMYSKCGDVERARSVFSKMEEKNVYTWSCLMSGLAMNGFGDCCIELFEEMKEYNIKPNGVTFLALLKGCSLAGLVDEALGYFESMKTSYGIEPRPEHYGCMVDLYGRVGRLDDAFDFINGMPITPHVEAWGALLNACRMYKNIELGELAMKKMVELESGKDSAYVLLSNIYANSRNWKGASGVRKLMMRRGVKKEPGCSVIEVNGEVHEFFIDDRSHPRYKEIEDKLREVSKRLKVVGYLSNIDEALFDIEEEEKEDAVIMHSEKLAIAFGIVALEEGIAIRVVKNLRVCRDCHEFAKIASKEFNRDIIMRDRKRFHHFNDGVCSCKDYW